MGHGWNKKIHTNGGWLVIYHGRIRNQKNNFYSNKSCTPPINLTWNLKKSPLWKRKKIIFQSSIFGWSKASVLIPTSSSASALRALRPDATFDISHRHWWPPSKPPRWPNAERGRRVLAAVVFTNDLEVVKIFWGAPAKTKQKMAKVGLWLLAVYMFCSCSIFFSKHNLQITICVNCLEQLWVYPEFKASYINNYKYKSTTQEWTQFLSPKRNKCS